MARLVEQFDHLVVAVRDLKEAQARWGRLGLDVRPGGSHPGLGTHNAIIRFEVGYIELLAIQDPTEARAGQLMAPILTLLEGQEEAMVGLCLATSDIEALAQALAGAGLHYQGPTAMSRRRPDGSVLRWRLLVPEGGPWRRPIPFFIQWDAPDDLRRKWEPPGKHLLGARGVAAVGMLVDDTAWATRVYAQALGLRLLGEEQVPDLGARLTRLSLGDCRLELLSPAGPGEVQEEWRRMGPGPFRLCLRVAHLGRAREHLAAAGAGLTPEPGFPEAVRVGWPGLGLRLALVEEARS